jgi:beta-lactamase class C
LFATVACLGAGDQRVRFENSTGGVVIPVKTKYDIPEIAAATSGIGEPFGFSYSVASKNTRKPVTPNSLFELGSISKTFTASLASFAQQER